MKHTDCTVLFIALLVASLGVWGVVLLVHKAAIDKEYRCVTCWCYVLFVWVSALCVGCSGCLLQASLYTCAEVHYPPQ